MNDYLELKAQSSIHEYAEQKLERKGSSFICPFCSSGKGKRGTPAFSIMPDDKSFTCFSCNAHGDIFDLAGAVIQSDNKREQLEEVARFYNFNLTRVAIHPINTDKKKTPNPINLKRAQGMKDHQEYIQTMRANLEHEEVKAYLSSRGFTLEEACFFGLGYDPFKHRLIIPWYGSTYYHVDRSTNGSEPRYTKPKAEEVGKQPLWNKEAINKGKPFFIVEGALDALSIQTLGYEAICLGGTGSRQLLESINYLSRGAAILLLDNDEAGEKAQAQLKAELMETSLAVITPEIKLTTKDAAELFASDREALRAFLSRYYDKALDVLEEKKTADYNEALKSLKVVSPELVAQSIFTLENEARIIPTGFYKLDDILNGGLTKGLYILGAVSSLGKTTLTIQIADQIAAAGYPVLFVTIEQSAEELIAKSLSRGMYREGAPASTSELLSSSRREYWKSTKLEAFLKVCNAYTEQVSPNLLILEGDKQPSVNDIRVIAQTVEEYQGQAPVIFIDYLQLLAPYDDRDTDKKTTDRNVMSLRQLARDLKTPIFAISSLNRSSYTGTINLDSFKESGAIEYGADVLLGFQPHGMEDKLDGLKDNQIKREANKIMKQTKAELKRECELVILKQRNGRTPENGIKYTFEPIYSLFTEEV